MLATAISTISACHVTRHVPLMWPHVSRDTCLVIKLERSWAGRGVGANMWTKFNYNNSPGGSGNFVYLDITQNWRIFVTKHRKLVFFNTASVSVLWDSETRVKCNDREGNSLEYLLMIYHGIIFTKYNNTTHIHSTAPVDLAAIVPTLSYLYAYSHQKMQSTKWILLSQTHYHKLIN